MSDASAPIGHTLGLVLPVHNEEEVVGAVVRRLATTLEEAAIPFRIVVVDNASTDHGPEIVDELARHFHPNVQALRLHANIGYGGAIRKGLSVLDTPLLGWYWSDGQVDPEVVVQAWRQIATGGMRFVKARRVGRKDGPDRAFVSRVFNRLARIRPGVRTADINGCPKIFTRELHDRLVLREDGWLLDLEIVRAVERLGVPIGEVEALMQARTGGASHVRWTTVLDFLAGMLRLSARS